MGWQQHGLQRTFRTGQLIQLVHQDVFDPPITVNFIGKGIMTGAFQSGWCIFPRKTQNTMQIIVPRGPETSESAELEKIQEALSLCAGNQTRAAALLGIARRTLVKKLASMGLPRPRR